MKESSKRGGKNRGKNPSAGRDKSHRSSRSPGYGDPRGGKRSNRQGESRDSNRSASYDKPGSDKRSNRQGESRDSNRSASYEKPGSGKRSNRQGESRDSNRSASYDKPGGGKRSNRQGESRDSNRSASYDKRGGGKRSNRQNESISESARSGIRLNRYISNTGICSRREADELIRSGQIQVNGKTVTEMGTKLGQDDSVTYQGKKLRGEKKVYVLLNKPKDTVTTVRDTHDRKTVMDLVSGCCTERIYPVGRLDRNTTGVLLLTNDGDLAETLSHPSFNKKKIYHIHIDKGITTADMEKLSEGFELEDGFIRPDRVEYVEANDRKQIGMEIHSGRNRIVRRIFEQLGYKVLRLDRVYYAGLTKKGLSRGRWRHLSPKEVGMLKMSVPGKKFAEGKKIDAGKKFSASSKVGTGKKIDDRMKVSTGKKVGASKKVSVSRKVSAGNKVGVGMKVSAGKKVGASKKVSTGKKVGASKKVSADKKVSTSRLVVPKNKIVPGEKPVPGTKSSKGPEKS